MCPVPFPLLQCFSSIPLSLAPVQGKSGVCVGDGGGCCELGPGRFQPQEGSCITILYNLPPFPLPSSRGDGYCLIPFDSSFIICLPPSSFTVAHPRLLCGHNQSLVSDGDSGGGEGRDVKGVERGWLSGGAHSGLFSGTRARPCS